MTIGHSREIKKSTQADSETETESQVVLRLLLLDRRSEFRPHSARAFETIEGGRQPRERWNHLCCGRVKTTPDDPRDTLQKLIETCRDGETGYLHAASVADDSELKSYFQQQSLEPARFRVELTDAISQLGERDPDTSGSSTAMLHRAWFEVKDDFGGGDHTLLESVEEGEDSAKQSYESALETNVPAGIDVLVRSQYGSVKAAHDRVRRWRDEKAA